MTHTEVSPAPLLPPAAAGAPPEAAPAFAEPPLFPAQGYLKGQLHLHTSMSGDSDTPPNQVARFYAEHGYDFIVVTDHNHITELLPHEGSMLVLPGVELTRSTKNCDPPPEKKCLVHVNALFVDTPAPTELPVGKPDSNKRLALYMSLIVAAHALHGLTMLNHPNFGWTADAQLAAEIGRRGVPLLEFANQGMPRSNPGDATHLSSEALWDAVLSAGVRMWGVASDDAHHYYDVERARAAEAQAHAEAALRAAQDAGVGDGSVGDAGVSDEEAREDGRDAGASSVYPGDLGWVMVHAERDAKAIRAALERGDFYASTGVTLAGLVAEDDALVVDVAGPGPFRIECIGEGGRVLDERHGVHARCVRPAESRYVRVRVTDAAGHQAWTQPLYRP